MKNVILTFGLISGVISSALMMLGVMPFVEQIGFDNSMYVGYAAIVLSFLLVFFGVKSYRDNVAGGSISFGTAFKVGLGITLISCAFYVITWEIVYFSGAFPDFMDKYTAHILEQARAEGASDAALLEKAQEMAKMKEWYKNPLFNAAMTLLEPLPVGLLITLISAAVLKKKPAHNVAVA